MGKTELSIKELSIIADALEKQMGQIRKCLDDSIGDECSGILRIMLENTRDVYEHVCRIYTEKHK